MLSFSLFLNSDILRGREKKKVKLFLLTPVLFEFQAGLDLLSKGLMLADVVAIIGTSHSFPLSLIILRIWNTADGRDERGGVVRCET